MNNTEKTIIFVPDTLDVATYKLNNSEINALLSSLPDGYTEVDPGSGVYKVHNIENVAKAYASLFTS